MSFVRMLITEHRRIMVTPLYAVMLVLVAAVYFISGLEELQFMRNFPGVDVLYFFDIAHNIGYFVPIALIACAVSSSYSFIDDFERKHFNFIIIRSSREKYIISKILATATAGGIVLAGGLLLYFVVMGTMFPLVAENSTMLQSYIGAEDIIFVAELLNNGYYVQFFAVFIVLSFLFGALWSVVGLLVSAFIPNKFISAFSPYVIWHFSILILRGSLRTEVVLRANYTLGGFGISLIYAIVYFSLLILFCGLLFRARIMRRITS